MGGNVGAVFGFAEPKEIENGLEEPGAIGGGSADGISAGRDEDQELIGVCSHRSAVALAALGIGYCATYSKRGRTRYLGRLHMK